MKRICDESKGVRGVAYVDIVRMVDALKLQHIRTNNDF